MLRARHIGTDLHHSQMQFLNAFTVDVEDYYQVSAFEKHIGRDRWARWESRVEYNTQRMLQLLDRHNVHGTFFVLGWVARQFPQLVREIHACGHEVGSHGYWHRLIYELSPGEFREDLRQSRAALEDAIGAGVTAHRAASFSITARSLWALEILLEEGFSVDSSIVPVYHDRYGIPHAPRRLHRVKTPSGELWEFPPSVVRLARINLPVGGGGYFRLFPLVWTRYCLCRINRRERQPFVFYMHPWEIDPHQPLVPARSRLSRFRHYVGLRRCEGKLDRLLSQFRFGRLSDVIAKAGAAPVWSGYGSAASGKELRRAHEDLGAPTRSEGPGSRVDSGSLSQPLVSSGARP
jgi:polysaccharide deacetylase family protein (PEP-CTERM system associated)